MRFRALFIACVVAGAALGLGLALVSTRAEASQMGAVAVVGDEVPAAGMSYADSFTVSCGASATAITTGSSQTVLGGYCQILSTTMVAVGDSGIGDPTSGQNSPVHCTTNCPSAQFGFVRGTYCRADTGTVTAYCNASVPNGPN